MKSKFSKILQLKEKEVEIARLNLEKATTELNQGIQDLIDLQSRASEVDIPTSGNVSMLQYTKLLKDSFRNEVLRLKHTISLFENEVNQAKSNLHSISLEFEKFKHLHGEEVKRRLKELAEKESKELDEIATQRFFNNKGKF